jgi:hypothetical protein
MRSWFNPVNPWLIAAGLCSAALAVLFASQPPLLVFTCLAGAWVALGLWIWGLGLGWQRLSRHPNWRRLSATGLVISACVLAGLGFLRTDLLPQRVWYDCIANRKVTEWLVAPSLLKVERWNILGKELDVLFVHPAPSGSTALVYPVRVEAQTTFRASLAIAPQAWTAEGDGVVFSLYVEDDAGFHLLYSQYVDPKHQQQDQRWIPIQVSLSSFTGELVRLILTVNSGVAGDRRYDWSGWGEPHLERPAWPGILRWIE